MSNFKDETENETLQDGATPKNEEPKSFVTMEDLNRIKNNEPQPDEPIKKKFKKRATYVQPSIKIKRKGRKPSVKKLRINLGFNQMQMANKLGVSQGLISLMESGKLDPSPNVLDRIYKLAAKAKK